MSGKPKKRKKGLSLPGLTVLLVLCVVMILVDLYLLMSASLSSGSTAAAEETETVEAADPEVSSLPQIIQVEQPDVQLTDSSDAAETAEEAADDADSDTESALSGTWMNSQVSFQYDTWTMWVEESGGVISVTYLTDSTLPRMDIQILEDADDLTEEEFASLADAAVRAYFSAEPDADAIEQGSLDIADGLYEAELIVSETDVSPAMLARVRLEDGVLTTLLLELTADERELALWLSVLQTVTPA